MISKLVKTLGYLLLTAIVLAVGVAVWFGINASRNTDVARPYFEAQLPVILSWDFQQLEPLLAPSLKEKLSAESGQQVFRQFARLGELKSFEQLQYVGGESDVAVDGGVYDLLNFSMVGHFSAGDALVLITLAQTEDNYMLYGLNIRSDAIPMAGSE